jgi:hypothetical protein
MEYITGSCVINEQEVFKNGEKVFSARANSAALDVSAAGLSAAANSAAADLWAALYQHFGWQYPKYFKMDHLSKLGFAATEVLLQGWDASGHAPEEIAVVLSNANSSLDTDYRYNGTTKDIPSPSVFVYTLPNIVIGEICIRHRFKGENAFFLSPIFDPALLHRYVSLLFDQDIARVCIAGWVELLGDSYKAALFLIEKTPPAGAETAADTETAAAEEGFVFSAENMDRIFKNLTHVHANNDR